MVDVMVDLETMGKGSDAAITAIGAVMYDAEAGKLGSAFYEVVDLESSVDSGGVITPSTVMWWLSQSDEARQEFTNRKGKHLAGALIDFSMWFRGCQGVRVWGNGADFDCVVLRNAYKRLDMEEPWDFRNSRCFRTAKAGGPMVHIPDEDGGHHNALSDAVWQAKYMIEMARVRRQGVGG